MYVNVFRFAYIDVAVSASFALLGCVGSGTLNSFAATRDWTADGGCPHVGWDGLGMPRWEYCILVPRRGCGDSTVALRATGRVEEPPLRELGGLGNPEIPRWHPFAEQNGFGAQDDISGGSLSWGDSNRKPDATKSRRVGHPPVDAAGDAVGS